METKNSLSKSKLAKRVKKAIKKAIEEKVSKDIFIYSKAACANKG